MYAILSESFVKHPKIYPMLKKSTILFILGVLCLPICIFAQSKIIYVNTAAIGTNAGNNWQNAYVNLSTALDSANYGDSVFVAKGKYVPSINDRNDAFILKSGIRLFGGFAGTEKKASQRNFLQNTTVLSGDIGVKGDSTDNSYNVIRGENLDSTTRIDGFRIVHGNSNGGDKFTIYTSNLQNGGAMYLRISKGKRLKLTIENCQFESNTSLNNGSVIFSNNENGGFANAYEIINCTAYNNATIGAMIHDNSYVQQEQTSTVNIKNSKFKNPKAYTFIDDNGQLVKYPIKSFYGGYNLIDINSYNNSFENYTQLTGFNSMVKTCVKNCGQLYIFRTKIVTDSCYFDSTRVGFGSKYEYDGFLVKNSTFENESYEYGDMNTSVENCTFKNYAFTIKSNKYIRGSVFENYNNRPINIVGTLDDKDLPMIIENCVFRNNQNLLLRTYRSNLAVNGHIGSIYLVNNTFYNNDCSKNEDVLLKQSSLLVNLFFTNNILMNSEKNKLKIGTGTVKIENSIFDGNGKNLVIGDTVYNSAGAIVYASLGIVDISNSLFNTKIDFKSVKDNDFSLLPCSKAINFGKDIDKKFNIKTDFDKKPRIKYGITDAGAYEFQDFKINNYVTKPTFCTSKQGSFLPIFEGNCSNSPTITWENAQKQTGSGGEKLSAGVYTFFVKDTNGCADTLKNITIEDKGNISADFNIFNTSGTNAKNGSITVTNVNNGKAPFKYIWSNGDTTKTTEYLKAGDYKVTISDANGCVFSTTLTVKAASATSDIFLQNISATPNPASDKIMFSYDISQFGKELFVTFYDLQGKIILAKQKLKANEQIDVSSFAKGLYFWQITDNQYFTKINKIVIQ